MRELQDFMTELHRINSTNQTVEVVQARVSAYSAPEIDLDYRGTVLYGVRHLDSYSPTIGDVVWGIRFGSDLIILGKLA